MQDQQEYTVTSAREAAEDGHLGEWVSRFLASPGSDNADLGEQLSAADPAWCGPVELPLEAMHRLAGPSGEKALDEFSDDDLARIDSMAESLRDGWEPAPLVVSYDGAQFVVEDGNHRIEALRRAGRDRYWTVVAASDAGTRTEVLERFGSSD